MRPLIFYASWDDNRFERRYDMKKKGLVILLISLLLIGIGVGLFFLLRGGKSRGGNGKLVYVEKVENLIGGYLGQESRFMGVVESQETTNVEKDPDKNVKEVLVKVGDIVKEGDPLFTYDTQQAELDIESKELELESLKNGIQSDYEQVAELKKLRNNSSGSEKLSYSSQINSLLAKIHEDEYNVSLKEVEIQRARDGLGQSVVTSPRDGVVKSIQSGNNQNNDPYNEYGGYGGYGDGSGSAYMTIMAVGDYRVKGTVTEMSVHSLRQGMPVILRSRVDQSQIWRGTITTVNLEPEQDENGGKYYYEGSMGESASKYSFYVDPENSDGLILGQHLYIEQDNGQGEKKDGLYIPSYYLMEEDGGYRIWKRGSFETLEKAVVEVGTYDEMTDSYEITNGLTKDDYIAFPEERNAEGNPTSTNYEEVAKELASEENGESDPIDPEQYDPEKGLPGDDSMVDEGNIANDDLIDQGYAVWNGEDGMAVDDDTSLQDVEPGDTVPEGEDPGQQEQEMYNGAVIGGGE